MSATPKIQSTAQRAMLLGVARETAEEALAGGSPSEPCAAVLEGRFGGAFVTFWAGMQLRGCVGRFGTTVDLVQTVREVTRQSLADSRFQSNPITKEELSRLEIEISVLSDLEPTTDPESLVCGVHGILIRRGDRSGCFLPNVASDRGWSPAEFLSNCCTMKAGLPADAWRDPETSVSLFTADVFSESRTAVEEEGTGSP